MTRLSVVRPKEGAAPITLTQILTLLHPDNPDGIAGIERDVKELRETFDCPYVVPDYEHFKEVLFRFFRHFHITYYGAAITPPSPRDLVSTDLMVKSEALERASLYQHWKRQSHQFCERYLGHQEIHNAERSAITGRDGGVIAIIDKITDAILKEHIEIYVHSVFYEFIPSSDFDLRYRLAAELMSKYGQYLFPDEELLHPMVAATNLEAFVSNFSKMLHGLRRIVRW
jgi:hypothetical protein